MRLLIIQHGPLRPQQPTLTRTTPPTQGNQTLHFLDSESTPLAVENRISIGNLEVTSRMLKTVK